MPESHAETCIGWALTFYQKIVMLTNHQALASIKLQVLTLQSSRINYLLNEH